MVSFKENSILLARIFNGIAALAVIAMMLLTCADVVLRLFRRPIPGGATIFGHFMAVTQIPFMLANWVSSLPLPREAIMGVIIFLYLFGGCFMDSLAMIMLTIPIFYPVAMNLGFNPIWFGVIIVLVTEMGVLTPPVGVNVYVVHGIARDVPLETIFKGVAPFVLTLLVCAGILLAFPQIVLLLPSLIK
jgi:C4-dicarboxylate transporter DctM subunit